MVRLRRGLGWWVACLPVLFCLAGARRGLGLETGQRSGQVKAASAEVRAAEVAAAVGLLCSPRNLKRDAKGQVSGCRVCPAGSSFAGDGNSSLELDAQIAGHFTSGTADNLILDGMGCEPHAANFGGSYVFAMQNGKPRLVRYNAGLITDQCHKFEYSDGREYLVCRGGWVGQGEVDSVVSMVAFTAGGKGVSTALLSLQDTTGECGGPDAMARDSEIKGIRFAPPDSARITGLTITATLGTVSCKTLESAEGEKAAAKMVKTYEVEFGFDGKQFKVTPASRAALNKLTPAN